MLKTRLIPVLLLQNGLLVRSELFNQHQVIGNPIHEVERFNHWSVDELIYLDISRDDNYDMRRDDAKIKNSGNALDIIESVSNSCFMPLTWGGRIRSIENMRSFFARGADKVAINTIAWHRPEIIEQAAKKFGSQAIVVSIDVKTFENGNSEVFVDGGREATGITPVAWAREIESRGAGELLIQSINRDGTGRGYDLNMIEQMSAATSIPIIACSGVGRFEDYAKGIKAGASAVAAANIWHFKEMADRNGKRAMRRAGINVR